MKQHAILSTAFSIGLSLLLPQMANAAVTINSYRPIIDPATNVIETYDAWMARVVPLAIPSSFHAVGPINAPFSGTTTAPIIAPAISTSAPALSFTRGPGVTQLGVSNLVAGQGIQFVSDLSVGNDMNWSDINIDTSNAVTAFGFGVESAHDISVPTYGDSQFSITLFDATGANIGSGTVIAPSINPLLPNGAQESDVMPGFTFVGILSDKPFNRIEIRESRTYPTGGIQNATPTGGFADRESFGAFYANIFAIPDTQAPTMPTKLSAKAVSNSQINLSWSASTDNVGVTGYKVYRNGVLVGTPSSTGYNDAGLKAATSYKYTVAACDAAHNCSAQTSAETAKTKAANR